MAKMFNFHLTAVLVSIVTATGGEMQKPEPVIPPGVPPGYVEIPREEWAPETLEDHGIKQFEANYFEDALDLLRRAAMHGRGKAQYYLGTAYASGSGVQQDQAEAVKWYQKAVRRGYLPAYYCLANRLRFGTGVEKNPAEAFRLCKIAAERGRADGQFELGQCYEMGVGVDENSDEAEKWYRRAAIQGEKANQAHLVNFYWNRWNDIRKEIADIWRKEPSLRDRLWEIGGSSTPRIPALDNMLMNMYMWQSLSTNFPHNGSYSYLATNTFESMTDAIDRPMKLEAFRRAAAFVPRRENTNDWLSGAEPPPGLGDPEATGTGFFISDDGYILSNFHVVDDSLSIMVRCGGTNYPAKVIRIDQQNDIALLKVSGAFRALPLANSRASKLGDAVFTVGFPNTQLQGTAAKFTDGRISSLTGAGDDVRFFQISVPVQPGNSGGALVTSDGNVVGIVTARLSDQLAMKQSGAIPQNVNYAVKSDYILSFLQSLSSGPKHLKQPRESKGRKIEACIKEVTDASVMVMVY